MTDAISFKTSVKEFATKTLTDSTIQMSTHNSIKQSIIKSNSNINTNLNTNVNGKLQILELYKFPKQLRDIFLNNEINLIGKYFQNNLEIFTKSEIRELIIQYIEKYQLEDSIDHSNIKLMASNELFPIAIGIEKSKDNLQSKTQIQSMKPKTEQTASVSKVYDDMPLYDEIDEYSEEIPSENPFRRSNIVGGVTISNDCGSTINDFRKPINKPVTDKVWKPIMLPTMKEIADAKKATMNKSKNQIQSQMQSQSFQQTKQKIKNNNENEENIVINEIIVRKDDFMKAILKKMTSYNAIIGSDGSYLLIYYSIRFINFSILSDRFM